MGVDRPEPGPLGQASHAPPSELATPGGQPYPPRLDPLQFGQQPGVERGLQNGPGLRRPGQRWPPPSACPQRSSSALPLPPAPYDAPASHRVHGFQRFLRDPRHSAGRTRPAPNSRARAVVPLSVR